MDPSFSDDSTTRTASAPSDNGPRLAPIETPDSWILWLAYRLAAWTMGTVITPMKVVQARFPESLRLAHAMHALEDKLTVYDALRVRIKRHVAARNGCAFCTDMADAQAEAVDGVAPGTADAPASDRVQAALDYATAVTDTVAVDDATFERLRTHFSEREIVEITWMCATENYYNRMAVPLGIGADGLCTVSPQ
jgi:alkylhydroperoxidase family enzyme